jgi:hypothetical protein
VPVRYIISIFFTKKTDYTNYEIRKILSVYGYVAHYLKGKKGMKEVGSYTTRRWDLYHTLNILRCSLIPGFVFGLLFRTLSIFCIGEKIMFECIEILINFIFFPLLLIIDYNIKKSINIIIKEYEDVTKMLFKNLNEKEVKKIKRLIDEE